MAPLKPLWMLASLLLTCCAAVDADPPARAADAGMGKAERIAGALATAGGSAGKLPELERALIALDALGATSAPGADDPVPGWRAQLPPGSPAARPLRGRALGAAYRQGWLEAGGSVVIEQIFLAGQPARVALAVPGGGGVSLTVHGQDQRPVCTTSAGQGACQWLPLYTQRFALRLSNGAGARTRYFLVVE